MYTCACIRLPRHHLTARTSQPSLLCARTGGGVGGGGEDVSVSPSPSYSHAAHANNRGPRMHKPLLSLLTTHHRHRLTHMYMVFNITSPSAPLLRCCPTPLSPSFRGSDAWACKKGGGGATWPPEPCAHGTHTPATQHKGTHARMPTLGVEREGGRGGSMRLRS